jgi:dephospho-CoA kinase
MIIGVTGLIGSGKSEVAAVFCKQGAKLIDCDRIGREVVEKDRDLQYRLVLEFGDSILTTGKKLDRRQLGRLAFSNVEKTEALNSIVHPALLAELDRRMAKARQENYHAVVDAALLIYWEYQKKVDFTILVSSHTRNRIRRLLDGGLSRVEIERRTSAQLPLSYLRTRSDFVLTNNEDLISLRKKAKILYLELTKRKIG